MRDFHNVSIGFLSRVWKVRRTHPVLDFMVAIFSLIYWEKVASSLMVTPRSPRCFCCCIGVVSNQGWGQFHFFNSIPIPLLAIPIPLLTISSNSNSGDSNSNSGDFKSRKSQFQKWPVDVFLEIDYNHTNKVHVYNIIVINIISLISFVRYINMASWLILYQ